MLLRKGKARRTEEEDSKDLFYVYKEKRAAHVRNRATASCIIYPAVCHRGVHTLDEDDEAARTGWGDIEERSGTKEECRGQTRTKQAPRRKGLFRFRHSKCFVCLWQVDPSSVHTPHGLEVILEREKNDLKRFSFLLPSSLVERPTHDEREEIRRGLPQAVYLRDKSPYPR